MPNHEELLEILLNNRGIKRKDWDNFLNPSYENGMYDPYLLKDMESAVIRIYEGIEAKDKIVIYSDYDADGIPSAVIMSDFFKKIGYSNFFVYIPDRHDEGYGLHMDAINEFIKIGVNLIITFDLGITAIEEVMETKINDIDVVIIDHHLPIKNDKGEDVLPKALAVIDPKREDCNYPDDMLCGAGLAYKLVQALTLKYGDYFKLSKGWEKWLLDMAGLATLADQVPLINENRIIAYYGLKVLRKSKRPGLFELFKKNGIDIKNIAEEDITFTLAPRINVASRMDNPMLAFNLLSENDSFKAKNIVDALEKINNERKISVASIMKEVKHKINKRYKEDDFNDTSFLVLGDPKWHIGVLGIVASKVVDEYKKSVFVWGGDDGDIRGSCRGYGDVNLVEIMSLLPNGTLLNFGGHKSAGGFSVSREEIHFLEEKLKDVFVENEDNKSEDRLIDCIIDLDDVNNDNYRVIEKLAPYGMGNPKPMFMLKQIEINYIKEFGKDKNHLELGFKNSRGKVVKAISFFKTRNDFNNLNEGEKIDMIATFEKSNFLGREELRLRIVDVI